MQNPEAAYRRVGLGGRQRLAGTAVSAILLIGLGVPANVPALGQGNRNLASTATERAPIPEEENAQDLVRVVLPIGDRTVYHADRLPGGYISVLAIANTGLFSPTKPRVVGRDVFHEVLVIRLVRAGDGPIDPGVTPVFDPHPLTGIEVWMPKCEVGYLTWFLGNARLMYGLPSWWYYDGGKAESERVCARKVGDEGVTARDIDALWRFTSLP